MNLESSLKKLKFRSDTLNVLHIALNPVPYNFGHYDMKRFFHEKNLYNDNDT